MSVVLNPVKAIVFNSLLYFLRTMAKKKTPGRVKDKSVTGEQKIKLKTRKFYNIRIKEILDEKVWDLPIVTHDEVALNVLAILSSRDHVWVVEDMESMDLVGVITEHDILNILSPEQKTSFFGRSTKRSSHLEIFESADHIMSDHPITVKPKDTVGDVLRKMSTHGCRRMAVVDEDDRIIGEITLHHIIRHFYQGIKPLSKLCADQLEKRRQKRSE